MRRSRGYGLVRWRIEHELELARRKLELDSDFATACTLRGYIQALRMVLHLPVVLSEEAAERQAKRERDHSVA